MKRNPAPPFVIRDIIAAQSTMAVCGPSHIGKTFLAVDMAFTVAAGIPWHGVQVRQSPVVYIVAEGHTTMRPRVLAWRQDNGIHPAVGVGVHFLNRSVHLPRFPDPLEFEKTLSAIHPRPQLVIVDTLARCVTGRDFPLDVEACRVAIDMMQAAGLTVIALQHEDDGEGVRTALCGAVGAVTILERGPNPKEIVFRSFRKHRYGQGHSETWHPVSLILRTVELPDGTTSCVIDTGVSVDAPIPATWWAALQQLPTEMPGITYTAWYRLVQESMSRSTFMRMIRHAKKTRLLTCNGERYRRSRA